MNFWRRPWFWFLAVALLALAVRVRVMDRSPLWVDEVFSLAIATGHSLEHPASAADPAQGDFVQGESARPAGEWAAYARHDPAPAGPGRVVRAVFLSDTNPPLYYLALWGWTRTFGTSDAALRFLSVLCAMPSLCFLFSIARRIGGDWAAWFAAAVFAISPTAIYFSIEGRMYSLVWLLVTALAWASLRLQSRGDALAWVVWIGAATLGLLTHYFFLFPLAGIGLWLLLAPGRIKRVALIAAGAGVLLLVAPWYALVPRSLAAWRVTEGWLNLVPKEFFWPWSFGRMVGGLVGLHGRWDADLPVAIVISLGLICCLVRSPRSLFGPSRLMLWMWVGAALAGPAAIDWLRGTYTVDVPRYAIAALPAAAILLGCMLDGLGRRAGVIFLVLIAAAGLHVWRAADLGGRHWQNWWGWATILKEQYHGGDVILVQSIPSGVIATARYCPPDLPLAAWVEQLRPGQTADVDMIIRGSQRVLYFRLHDLAMERPLEGWLGKRFVETPVYEGILSIYSPRGDSSRSDGQGVSP